MNKKALYPLLMAKNLGDFRLNLRANVRRYWRGGSKNEFITGFFDAVDRGFNQAFRAGAAECGIKPADFTDKMNDALQDKINDQFPHISSLADSIIVKSDGGKFRDAVGKIEIWAARYGEVANIAKGITCGDKNLKWVLGAAEHCPSCVRLSGIVKRASFWNGRGILPRTAGAIYLECKGYNCKCSLEPTSDPITKGRLPKLP